LIAIPLLGLVLGATGVRWWRSHGIGPVQRGWTVASKRGCLACHGPSGRHQEVAEEGQIGVVPSFVHDDVVAYSRHDGEIREWILDGKPRRIREQQGDEKPALLQMPAWRDRLSGQELEDLVAWITAVSDFEEPPAPAASGREIAARLGCFGCHGPQGRGDTPNPGSLKGYIPSWSGIDYPELVRDDGELREWIRDGGPRRLRQHPVAAFFLRRQLIRMPAFGSQVTENQMRAIAEYIRWLRQPAAASAPARR
jgi:mono/diheme cytochrome c family protein